MKPILTLLLASLALSAAAQSKKFNITAGLTATVNHTQGSATVQVLIPGVEAMDLDISQPAGNTFLIKATDFNFDGYKDFALTSKDAAPGAPVLYDIYLYHPADKSFEALESPGGVCERLSNVRVNVGDKTLRSSCRAGAKSSLDIFKYADAFNLELVKSTDNSAEAQQEVAEEKAEKKADKADVRKEVREEKVEKRKERKEAKEDDDE